MYRATMCQSSGETTVYAALGTCYSVWMTVWYAPCMGAYQTVIQNKYTKNKLCTKLALFTRLNRDARSTKDKICCNTDWCITMQVDTNNIS
jgi:hypothetical protein